MNSSTNLWNYHSDFEQQRDHFLLFTYILPVALLELLYGGASPYILYITNHDHVNTGNINLVKSEKIVIQAFTENIDVTG